MSSGDLASAHYQRLDVKEEIARFAKGRWVGLHCLEREPSGRLRLVRYLGRARRPLKINSAEDVEKLLRIFSKFKPRTFYATANRYKSLLIKEDVVDLGNISSCMPTWDIDNAIEDWPATIEAAREIITFLEANGIEHSLFIKWSGKGCHVHLHGEAISEGLRRKVNPLDMAFAIVEYVNAKLARKYAEILTHHSQRRLRVDNEIDPQRLFTCPLSLHRELNRVCICIDKNQLDCFDLEWTTPETYKHFKNWGEYLPGEADELAIKAYKTIGPNPSMPRPRRRRQPPLDEQITKWLKKT